MTSHLWLLDNGHGSDTAGKRSPVWPDGRQLLEYEFNRYIVNNLAIELDKHGVRYIILVPEEHSVPLRERVRRANSYYRDNDCIFLSVHANAGGGSGWCAFTSEGETKSDPVATKFYEVAKRYWPDWYFYERWGDGDPDIERQFYVLRNTWMPAVLTENFFMDTLSPDCEYLFSPEGRETIIQVHLETILEIENA